MKIIHVIENQTNKNKQIEENLLFDYIEITTVDNLVDIHNGGNQDVVQILFEVHLSMVSQPLKNILLKEMSFEPIIDHFKYQHENCI